MSTFKYKLGAQKRKEKKKRNETISKHSKISEFFLPKKKEVAVFLEINFGKRYCKQETATQRLIAKPN